MASRDKVAPTGAVKQTFLPPMSHIVIIPYNTTFYTAQSYVVTTETVADVLASVNSSHFLPPNSPTFTDLFAIGHGLAGLRHTDRMTGYTYGQTFVATVGIVPPALAAIPSEYRVEGACFSFF